VGRGHPQPRHDAVDAAVDLVRKGTLLPKDALDAVNQRVTLELAKFG